MLIGIDASRVEAVKKTGVELYSYELLKAMRKRKPEGLRVRLYSRKCLGEELGPYDLDWENKVLKWPLGRLWTQARLSFEMIRNTPDLLFVPSHFFPRFLPSSRVITIHDAAFRVKPYLYHPYEYRLLNFALTDALKRATGIIVPSLYTKNLLISLGASSSSIYVIPHGVGQSGLGKKKVENSRQVSDAAYILCIGRIEKKKNLNLVIEAFQKLKVDLNLYFVGVDGYGANEIKKKASESQFSSKIRFLGYVPEAELRELLRGAKVLVHVCEVEGFGMSVLEAMSMRVPVVTLKSGAIGEVAHKAALFVHPVTASNLALEIKKALDEKVRKKLITAGLEQVKKYSWDTAAKKTWEVLFSQLHQPA